MIQVVTDEFQEIFDLARSLLIEFRENYWQQTGRELSEKEKFAIAFYSGIEIKADTSKMPNYPDDYNLYLKCKTCGIFWDGTKFLVSTLANK